MITKFRAWDEKEKRINLIDEIIFFDEYVTMHNGAIRGFDEVVIMQSTGLTDVNGKEIFEGDIVKARWWNIHGDHERVMLVEWNKNELGWNLINKSSTNMNYEVLGNIHEHPELLIQPK